jgi:hypothetical protein
MGHVHIAPGVAIGAGFGVSPVYAPGSATNLVRHPALQK